MLMRMMFCLLTDMAALCEFPLGLSNDFDQLVQVANINLSMPLRLSAGKTTGYA